jgi:hypothetical protein
VFFLHGKQKRPARHKSQQARAPRPDETARSALVRTPALDTTTEGLFAFETEDDALAAMDVVVNDYSRHSTAARQDC